MNKTPDNDSTNIVESLLTGPSIDHYIPRSLYSSIWNASHNQRVAWKTAARHFQMVTNSSSTTNIGGDIVPLCYIRFPSTDLAGGYNSSLKTDFSSFYYQIEERLLSLSNSAASPGPIEPGAVDTASVILSALRKEDYPPPELSWHGDDAVVMLWAIGDTTYAITITEGEYGYIVRRNRKTVKIADSLPVGVYRVSHEK